MIIWCRLVGLLLEHGQHTTVIFVIVRRRGLTLLFASSKHTKQRSSTTNLLRFALTRGSFNFGPQPGTRIVIVIIVLGRFAWTVTCFVFGIFLPPTTNEPEKRPSSTRSPWLSFLCRGSNLCPQTFLRRRLGWILRRRHGWCVIIIIIFVSVGCFWMLLRSLFLLIPRRSKSHERSPSIDNAWFLFACRPSEFGSQA